VARITKFVDYLKRVVQMYKITKIFRRRSQREGIRTERMVIEVV